MQITVAERVGVEGRGGFYEGAGAIPRYVTEPYVPAIAGSDGLNSSHFQLMLQVG